MNEWMILKEKSHKKRMKWRNDLEMNGWLNEFVVERQMKKTMKKNCLNVNQPNFQYFTFQWNGERERINSEKNARQRIHSFIWMGIRQIFFLFLSFLCSRIKPFLSISFFICNCEYNSIEFVMMMMTTNLIHKSINDDDDDDITNLPIVMKE